MEGRSRSEQQEANPHDSIHIYEAIAMVKKLGLSVKKDQEKVINLCIELATLKQEINRMRNMLGLKNGRIKKLKKQLKENRISAGSEDDETESVQFDSAENAYNIGRCDEFTQTDILELVEEATMTDDRTVDLKDQHTMTDDHKLGHKDAAAMTESLSVENRDQSTSTDISEERQENKDDYEAPLVSSFIQTDDAETAEIGTQTHEHNNANSSQTDPVVSHTMNTIKYACSMIEHSLNFQKELYRTNVLTQTDQENMIDKWEERNGSADSSSKLPPIIRDGSSKAQRALGNNKNSHYHKQCIPPKKRGKTWIF
ncbi:uncharacterized protein LOC135681306 isoform X2 [Rhopilema esculentum]|uniref:uncharacterized protein LOC135681306 isoform X2 n=1 Tax=Rhopilema esculentum TaxID=499914 RepID=UPI0031E33BB1